MFTEFYLVNVLQATVLTAALISLVVIRRLRLNFTVFNLASVGEQHGHPQL